MRGLQLFQVLRNCEAALLVDDWAVLALPSFSHLVNPQFLVWSLAVFLTCPTANPAISQFYGHFCMQM